MSKRKPENQLTNASINEDENDAGDTEKQTASEEVMKSRRYTDEPAKRKNENYVSETGTNNGESETTPSATSETAEKEEKKEEKPAFSFGTGSNFSFGFTPGSFSFGLGTSTDKSSTASSTDTPFPSFTTSFPAFSFSSDFKFPTFSSLASNTDADKTREATTNSSNTWSTDINLSTDTATPEKPALNLTKIDNPCTGEEGETTLAEARARLYEFEKGGWKERGIGTIKINSKDNKYRLLMRTENTLRVILNASIYKDMVTQEQDEKQLRFSCLNAVSEEATDLKITNFIVKFQTKQVFEQFFSALKSAKDSSECLKKAETTETNTTESKEDKTTTDDKESEEKKEETEKEAQ
jgi:hypothetical protein